MGEQMEGGRDMQLEADQPLAGFTTRLNDVQVEGLDGFSLVSVAQRTGGDTAAVGARLAEAFAGPGVDRSVLPDVGCSRLVGDGGRLMGLQPGQWWLWSETGAGGRGAVERIEALGQEHDGLYVTDQSDAWVGLRLSGPGAGDVLERLTTLDTAAGVFVVDGVARTVMHHVGVVMVREGETRWLLLSARSTAEDFRDAVVTPVA